MQPTTAIIYTPHKVQHLCVDGAPQERYACGEVEGKFSVGIAWGKSGHFPGIGFPTFPKIGGFVARYVGIEMIHQMRGDGKEVHQNVCEGKTFTVVIFHGDGKNQKFSWGRVPTQVLLSGDCVGQRDRVFLWDLLQKQPVIQGGPTCGRVTDLGWTWVDIDLRVGWSKRQYAEFFYSNDKRM